MSEKNRHDCPAFSSTPTQLKRRDPKWFYNCLGSFFVFVGYGRFRPSSSVNPLNPKRLPFHHQSTISHFLAFAEAVRGMAEAVNGLFYRLCRNSVKCLKFSDKWSENFGTRTPHLKRSFLRESEASASDSLFSLKNAEDPFCLSGFVV